MNGSDLQSVFITTDAVGGVWDYSVALATGWAKRGTRVILAVLGPAPDAEQCAVIEGVRGCDLVHTGVDLDWTMPDPITLDAGCKTLAKLAAQFGAQHAHVHAPALVARRWPMPVVAVAHSCKATWWQALRHGSSPPSDVLWHAHATTQGMENTAAVVAPSQSFAANLREVYGHQKTVSVVYNGIAELQIEHSKRQDYVLTAGRLWDEAKNMAVLDKAAGYSNVEIRAAGAVCGLDDNSFHARHVNCLGKLSPEILHASMATAAVFAAPSLYEPFGLAVLEAAALGTPLVLSDIPTFRELWDGAAIFLPARDAGAWASTLQDIISDSNKRDALGIAARGRARLYSQTTMIDRTVSVHRAIAASTRQYA